ncbi:MAG: nitrile hydratase accessory protein [Gammaproteobacteria bacterium]
MSAVDELTGTLAPPMGNGELLFDAPWQGRAFAMARALAEAGLYSWDEFREALIAAIGAWEAEPANEPDQYEYYVCFLAALESILLARGILEQGALHSLIDALHARPHGHDHTH